MINDIKLIDTIRPGIGDALELESTQLIYFKDLLDQNVTNYEYDKNTDLFKEDKRNILDFELNPGHYYIGDKEYYLFSEKVTDVIYTTSKDIPLKGFPNGYAPINLWGPFTEDVFCGTFKDELLVQNKTMTSLYLNESSDYYESGFSLATLCYPLKYNPYRPISELYSYWNKPTVGDESGLWESGIWPMPYNPLDYDYDLWDNKLQLNTNEITPGFYIAEYENTTLKTLTGSSFNPVTSLVEEGLLVLSSEKEDNKIDYIKILQTNNQVAFNKFTIIFEAYNFVKNKIINKYVDVSLKRNFYDGNGELLETQIDLYNEYYNKFIINSISSSEREIVENDIVIGTIPAFQNYFVVKNEGSISNNLIDNYEFSTKVFINENGLGIIYFQIPSIAAKEVEVELNLLENDVVLKTLSINNLNTIKKKSKVLTAGQKYNYISLLLQTDDIGTYISTTEINNPSEIEIYSNKSFIDNILNAIPLRKNNINNITFTNKEVKFYISVNESDIDIRYYIVRYIDNSEDFIFLDSTYVYGDL